MSQIQSRDFRGVIALDSVHALIDTNGDFVGVEFERLGAVGATPVRLLAAGKASIMRCDGFGDGDYLVLGNPRKHITVVTWHSFKMGLIVDLVNFVLTKARAASATVCLSYTFYRDGEIQVNVKSSAVPSVELVVDWRNSRSLHDMVTASSDVIEGFFNAGACVTAPTYNVDTLHLQASKELL